MQAVHFNAAKTEKYFALMWNEQKNISNRNCDIESKTISKHLRLKADSTVNLILCILQHSS